MAEIINYYKELNIGHDLSTAEINAELTKLKRVWIKRELSQPEKARRFLTLIDDAYEIFKTEETKAKYDQTIANTQGASGATNASQDEYKKWVYSANEYPSQTTLVLK